LTLFRLSTSSGLTATPLHQRKICITERQCIVGASRTCTSSCVPEAILSTHPSCRSRERPVAAASYSDSAVTSTECRTPAGPTKLTVQARRATSKDLNTTFAFSSCSAGRKRKGCQRIQNPTKSRSSAMSQTASRAVGTWVARATVSSNAIGICPLTRLTSARSTRISPLLHS
jgi:hypothetical protein